MRMVSPALATPLPSMSQTYRKNVPPPGILGFCDSYDGSPTRQPPLVLAGALAQAGSDGLQGCTFPVPLNATSTMPAAVLPFGSWYEPDKVLVVPSKLKPNVALSTRSLD